MNRRGRLLLAGVLGLCLMVACSTQGSGPGARTDPPSATDPTSTTGPTPKTARPATPTPDSATGPGPDAAFIEATPGAAVVNDGDDWSLPPWVRPAANSGFFSEDAAASDRVGVRSVDVSWRQLQPTKDGRSTGRRPGKLRA